MSSPKFSDPAQVETAFYDAFERADVEAMMAAWANHDQVVCIHPMGPPLAGRHAVRESWRQMFQGGPRFHFGVRPIASLPTGDDVVIRIVEEHIRIGRQAATQTPVLATNAYQRSAEGWRMILHHASPVRPRQASATAPSSLH